MTRNIQKNIPALIAVLLLVAAPAITNISRMQIIMTLLIVGFYFAIVAANWNLLFGYAGVWSLGQLGIFAIGAYSSALLSKSGISPWLAMLFGVGLSTLAALAISLIALRLKATYFALATLGFQEVVRGFVVIIYPGVVFDIPHLEIGGLSFAGFGGAGYYYAFLLLFMFTLLVHRWVMSSHIGYATVALRESEVRAISIGVEPVKIRTILFLISVVFTSLAGSIYAHYTNSVSQAILGFDLFLTYLIILAFGGIGTFYGPAIASFIWVFLDFILRLYIEQLRLIIMGGIVILSLVYLKRGLAEIYERIAERIVRQRAS